MEDSRYKKISVQELINTLSQELEIENPFIPEKEKELLVDLMAWDIIKRGNFILYIDPPPLDSYLTSSYFYCLRHN